jgi:hypothetical protein
VLSFLLGLGPACPLILLNQYILRRRRTWLKMTEWVWLGVSMMAIHLVSDALPRPYLDAFWSRVPEGVSWSLLVLFLSAGCSIPVLWLVGLLSQTWYGWSRATWSEWLAIVSVPLLYMAWWAWANGAAPL